VPFFGYNVGYRAFLKVYMLNPLHMTRFADLLHQGAILNRIFQPYESHLQYLLQWMCDYNLFGCDYINCAKVQFRGPVPDSDEVDIKTHKWHAASIPEAFISDDDQYPRQSHCTLEVDICVQDILNRHELQYRPIHHDFLERSSQMPMNPDDKYVPSMAGLWRDETRRRKRQMGLSDTASSPFPAEVMVSMSADPRNTDKGGWIHKEEYQELVKNLIEEEKKHGDDVSFGTFVKEAPGLKSIKTTVESVEDLYPENLRCQQINDDEEEQVQGPGPMGAENQSTMTLVNALPGDDVLPPNLEQLPDIVVGAVDTDEVGQGGQSDAEEQQSLDPLTVSLMRQSGNANTSDDNFDEGIDLVDPSDAGSIGDPNSPSTVRKRKLDPELNSPS
jgi:DNA polymerase zeta